MADLQAHSRSIPSLDGLRAFSVLIVILGHTESKFLDRIPFNEIFRQGAQGVAVFFVISGFLITHLLLKELKRDDQINLKRFYLRRTFRIFPPFYAYLLVVAVLGLLHLVQVDAPGLLAAASYTWNYVPRPSIWVIGHCWSLALEEQFYLLWPACMAFFSRRVNFWIAVSVLLLSPLSRVATYFAWPVMRFHMAMMLHTHLDTIMMGSLLALMIDMKIGQRVINLALHPVSPVLALLFLILVDGPAGLRWGGMYLMTVGYSLESVAIATLLLFGVFRHQSALGRLLNLAPVRHLGIISYSLYLWQQLFTGPLTHLFPLNFLFILGAAELSYLLVERPSARLRDRVQTMLSQRKALAPQELA
ncbi:MAG TPA: acyltransferase [Acidobacteriaceae bacterium]